MRAFLLILLVLAAAVGGWFLGNRSEKKSGTYAGGTSATDRLSPNNPKTVRGLGTLQPVSGLINIVAPPGERIATLIDKEVGDRVAKGELLVTLQSRVLRQKDLELAIARREDVDRKSEYEKSQATFQRDSAVLAIAEADASDDALTSQSKRIELLKRQLVAATQLLNRLQTIHANPDTHELVNETDLEKQMLVVDQIEVQIEMANQQLESARAQADRAKQIARIKLKSIEHAIQNAEQAIPRKTLDATVAMARQACELTQITSPIENATILDIIVRQGDSVTNRPIMVLGDTSTMQCVVEVNESFLRSINPEKYPNLRAKISSPAFTDPIMGTVIRKGTMLAPPSLADPNPFARVDRRTGTVTIMLDDPALAAQFVNLQVNVEIEVSPGALE